MRNSYVAAILVIALSFLFSSCTPADVNEGEVGDEAAAVAAASADELSEQPLDSEAADVAQEAGLPGICSSRYECIGYCQQNLADCMGYCLRNPSNAFCAEMAQPAPEGEKSRFQEPPQEARKGPGRSFFSPDLPECGSQVLTESPISLNSLSSITPLGNLNPPEHTLPTQHMYLEVGGASGNLKSPGEIYLLRIRTTKYLNENREDYGIDFALCEDVQAYFLHIQSLVPKLKALIKESDCQSTGNLESGNNYQYCNTELDGIKLSPGEAIGTVGRIFDFGLQDYRTKQEAANPKRYSDQMLSVVCPLDYFDSGTKSALYGKISRTQEPKCGKMIQDAVGTLQGSWFYGPEDEVDYQTPSAWDKHLAFVADNNNPLKSVISVGGVIGNAGRYEFTPRASGNINRKFTDVAADGKTYCYEVQPGRILVKMLNDDEIQVEQQNGGCSSNLELKGSFSYSR